MLKDILLGEQAPAEEHALKVGNHVLVTAFLFVPLRVPQGKTLLKNMYAMFVERDCTLVEINPLAETPEGRGEGTKRSKTCLPVLFCPSNIRRVMCSLFIGAVAGPALFAFGVVCAASASSSSMLVSCAFSRVLLCVCVCVRVCAAACVLQARRAIGSVKPPLSSLCRTTLVRHLMMCLRHLPMIYDHGK